VIVKIIDELRKPYSFENSNIIINCYAVISLYPMHSPYIQELLNLSDITLDKAKKNNSKFFVFEKEYL